MGHQPTLTVALYEYETLEILHGLKARRGRLLGQMKRASKATDPKVRPSAIAMQIADIDELISKLWEKVKSEQGQAAQSDSLSSAGPSQPRDSNQGDSGKPPLLK